MNALPTTARSFGERLRCLRCLKGMTQAELADKAGLSLRQISRIEHGTSSPSYLVLEKIAQALKTSLANLFIFPARQSQDDCRGEGGRSASEEVDSCLAESLRMGLFSSSLTGVCAINPRSEKMDWSGQAYTLLGFRPFSVKPSVKRFLQNVHPDCRDEAAAFIALGRQSGQGSFLLKIIATPSVRTLSLQVQNLPSQSGEDFVVHLILQDISDLVNLTQTLAVNRDELEEHVRQRNRELELAVQKFEHEAVERTKAEQNLRYYDLMVNNSQDAQVFVDKCGLIKTLNSAYERLTGFSANDLIGRDYAAFLSDHWGEPLYLSEIEALKRTLQHGEQAQREGWIRYQTGSRFVRWRYASCRDSREIVGVVVTIHDLTDIMTIQQQLAESEARFKNLLTGVPNVAVQGYLMDGTTDYWNPASEILYGYTAEEAIGKNLLDLIIPSEIGNEVRNAIKHMAKTGEPIPASELTLSRKDGSPVTVFSSHAVVRKQDGSLELFCIDVDLSERLLAERALRESEHRFRTLVENLPIMVNAGTRDGIFTYWNKACEEMTGYSREEIIGNPEALALLYPDKVYREQLVREVHDSGGLNKDKEWTLTAKNGSLHTVVCNNLPPEISFAEDELWAVCIDVTARKRAEEATRQREQFLEATAEATLKLLRAEDLESCIQDVLAEICRVTDSDRVYVFKNRMDPETGALWTSQIHEWVQPGVSVQMQNQDLHDSSMTDVFPRWLDAMRNGKAIMGHVRDFPDSERMVLEPQDIQSLLAVPIMVEGTFWGFMGLDCVNSPRLWTTSEESILRIIATAIGQSIIRKSHEEKIVDQNNLLQWLFDNLPLGVALLNEDGRLVRANCQLYELTGYSPDEIPSLAEWFPLAYPDLKLRQKVMDDWGRKPHLGDVPHEYPVTCKTGASKEMEFRWTHLPNGRSIVTMVDISCEISLKTAR